MTNSIPDDSDHSAEIRPSRDDSIDTAGRTFRQALSRPATLPIVALAGLLMVFLALIALLMASNRAGARTEQAIAAVYETRGMVVDMETGLRGFRLTGDARFLAPFEAAAGGQQGQIDELRRVSIGERDQQRRIDELDAMILDWRRWAQPRLVEGALGAPVDNEAALEGKHLMDRIRLQLDEMRDAEFEDRRAARQWLARLVWITVLTSLALTLGVGVWLARRWRKALRHTAATYLNALRLTRQQARQLREAHSELDKELAVVGTIQRGLLPGELPNIEGLDVAAFYRSSSRAGGDYYDFFPMPHAPDTPPERGQWGILMADVSGHGTPAAVVMAVTHSIAHSYEVPGDPPGGLMEFVNRRLCRGYTGQHVAFVTAFYAIYDPATRTLVYANAGHNPPRLMRHCPTEGTLSDVTELDGERGLPLGIDPDQKYPNASITLRPGEVLTLYTDGITEARNASDEFFDEARLDAAVCAGGPDSAGRVRRVIEDVTLFTDGDAGDDQTLVILTAT